MRIAKMACIGIGIALTLSIARADPVAKLSVEAGKVDRVGTPMWGMIKLPAAPSGSVVTLKSSGQTIPAQIQNAGDGHYNVFWIEPNLPAGQSRTYELNIDKGEPAPGFEFSEHAAEGYRDLSFAGKKVSRYMHRYDEADRSDTFKPFHHVFDFDGKDFITKGPGGLYTHHRGIFFGFNKTQYGDFWHCPDVSQRHDNFITDREFVGSTCAREIDVVNWVGKEGKPVARDTRQVTTWRVSPTEYAFDYVIKLEALMDDGLKLDGDPQHAGFHFRAAQEVAGTSKGTTGAGGLATYVRPGSAKFTKNDEWLTTPWCACSFTIAGNPYTVVIVDPTDNPKPGTFSTRGYGRFGAFFTGQVEKDKPLMLRYRLLVIGGKTPDESTLTTINDDFDTPAKVTSVK